MPRSESFPMRGFESWRSGPAGSFRDGRKDHRGSRGSCCTGRHGDQERSCPWRQGCFPRGMAAIGMLYHATVEEVGLAACMELFLEHGIHAILVPTCQARSGSSMRRRPAPGVSSRWGSSRRMRMSRQSDASPPRRKASCMSLPMPGGREAASTKADLFPRACRRSRQPLLRAAFPWRSGSGCAAAGMWRRSG